MDFTKTLLKLAVRVLAVGVLAVAMLAVVDALGPRVRYWYEHRLAMRLIGELPAGDAMENRAVLRQIASLDDSAIEALVVAAGSERIEIALAAREIVEQRLATWRIREETNEEFQLDRPVLLLARALATHGDRFGSLGKQWAHRLSLEMVEMADDFPVETSVAVLRDCSRVLEAGPVRGPRMRSDLNSNSLGDAEEGDLSLTPVNLPPWQRETVGHRDEGNHVSADEFGSGAEEIAIGEKGPNNSMPLADSAWIPEWTTRAPLNDLPRPAEIGQTIEQDLPTTQPQSQEVVEVPSPEEMAVQLERMRDRDTRRLLHELRTADKYTGATIRAVLNERGIRAEELSLAARVLAENKADRLNLIDDLKILPARTARRWLRELLKDHDPEVRLAALTELATTKDPELATIARELAVRDTDTKVTELAAKIVRERH